MRMVTILVAILASATFVAEARAQTQVPPPAEQSSPPRDDQTPARGAEKTVEGQVGSVDPSRTEITLTDGTRLVTPAGIVIKPGIDMEGMIVVARYTEENGQKVMTGIAVKDKGPSGSPKQN
jgi:hypothetical protein